MIDEEMTTDPAETAPQRDEEISNTSPPNHPTRTSTDPFNDLTEYFQDLEGEDAPVDSTATFVPATVPPVAASSFRHCFAIYRRHYVHPSKKPMTQLALFKTFVTCLKSIDSNLQILPIRNDLKVHPISTTDQIWNLLDSGLITYFKAYKRSQKSLSGDFNISTSLPFAQLEAHKNLQTWFHVHGYNIMYSGCQMDDMVKIGFLTRVRGFTYRDDLYNHIVSYPEWKASLFHLRLYYDSFSTNLKGSLTYVLMINVDHPNIDTALHFFHQVYDGKNKSPPNHIPYLFLPLYCKSDDERSRIIVTVSGLQDINGEITLTNGKVVPIHHLLLVIPAPDTSTGKLFLQVERQTGSEWLICCFHSTDSAKVTLCLSHLEQLLKRYVDIDHHVSLFSTPDHSIKFNQAAPFK
jgi:hypothetical protein